MNAQQTQFNITTHKTISHEVKQMPQITLKFS